jgi:hypothetical protein
MSSMRSVLVVGRLEVAGGILGHGEVRDVDHAGADAWNTAAAVVALLGGAEEQTTVLMHPNMPIAATAKSPVDWAPWAQGFASALS